MKTTLELPDDLMREVKIRAATQGRKLKDVVTDAIRKGLDTRPLSVGPPQAVITKHPTLGFPMVKCAATAPAATMPPGALLQLEQNVLAADDLKRAGLVF